MADEDKLDLSMFFKDFLNDAREGFQSVSTALLSLEKDNSLREPLDEVFRVMHTLKSSSVMLELATIAELAQAAEDLLDRFRKREIVITKDNIDAMFELVGILEKIVIERAEHRGTGELPPEAVDQVKRYQQLLAGLESNKAPAPQAGIAMNKDRGERMAKTDHSTVIEKISTVRVSTEVLDSLFNQVGELIIAKNRLDNITADLDRKDLGAVLSDMRRIINALQESVSASRMVPADEVFRKFPKMVRDLAKEKGRDVEFMLSGSGIELDKSMIDGLTEPLVHLLRNAVDHGVEPPEEREQRGKPGAGKVRLAVERTESHIYVTVEDDGRGIDLEKTAVAAVKKGFVKPEEAGALKEREILSLLFKPGFSSVENVTETSGRGVGLDVVFTSARRMGGTVEVRTRPGEGSVFALKLPLTTAIIHTLMVGVGDGVFAIPSDLVLETMEVKKSAVREIGGDKVLMLNKRALPLVMLNEALHIPMRREQDTLTAVVVYKADKFVALGVDAVLNQVENIIKPFDPIAQGFRGVSGGVIMGDGRVALLLDIASLVDLEGVKGE